MVSFTRAPAVLAAILISGICTLTVEASKRCECRIESRFYEDGQFKEAFHNVETSERPEAGYPYHYTSDKVAKNGERTFVTFRVVRREEQSPANCTNTSFDLYFKRFQTLVPYLQYWQSFVPYLRKEVQKGEVVNIDTTGAKYRYDLAEDLWLEVQALECHDVEEKSSVQRKNSLKIIPSTPVMSRAPSDESKQVEKAEDDSSSSKAVGSKQEETAEDDSASTKAVGSKQVEMAEDNSASTKAVGSVEKPKDDVGSLRGSKLATVMQTEVEIVKVEDDLDSEGSAEDAAQVILNGESSGVGSRPIDNETDEETVSTIEYSLTDNPLDQSESELDMVGSLRVDSIPSDTEAAASIDESDDEETVKEVEDVNSESLPERISEPVSHEEDGDIIDKTEVLETGSEYVEVGVVHSEEEAESASDEMDILKIEIFD